MSAASSRGAPGQRQPKSKAPFGQTRKPLAQKKREQTRMSGEAEIQSDLKAEGKCLLCGFIEGDCSGVMRRGGARQQPGRRRVPSACVECRGVCAPCRSLSTYQPRGRRRQRGRCGGRLGGSLGAARTRTRARGVVMCQHGATDDGARLRAPARLIASFDPLVAIDGL